MATKITMKIVKGRKITTVKSGNRFYCSNIKTESHSQNIIPKEDLFQQLGIRSI